MRADCFIVWLGVYVNVFQSIFVDVYCRSNSPLKRAGVDENPCSRVTVLSALKESRKRSFAVFDEGEEEVSRPSKRCVVNCIQQCIQHSPVTPKHQQAYSPYCSLYISQGADKENLCNNQKLLQLVIISCILMTLMFD